MVLKLTQWLSEADCKGQGTALTEGKYEFNDDFYVSSFGCLEWDRKEP